MGIVEGLVWPVLAAALIGLVALAVRQPNKYRKIANGLFFAGAALMIGAVVGIAAYERGAQAVLSHLSTGATPQSFESPFPLGIFFPMVFGFVWWLFIFGLESLGRYLSSDDNSKPSE